MKVKHVLLAISIALVWGVNFSVIKLGLNNIPPLFLCATRFSLVALSGIFFVKMPDTKLSYLILYSLLTFAGQFILLFFGIQLGISAGLAALVLQLQIIFSAIFAFIFLKEPIYKRHMIGSAFAVSGIALVASHTGGGNSLLGLLLTVGGAMTWAMGNILSKIIRTRNVIGLIVWGNFFAAIPLIILSYTIENAYWHSHFFSNMSMITIGCILYIVYPVTFYGFCMWSYLLNLYPASLVTPFALLIPVFGLIASSFIFGEPLFLWKIGSLFLLLFGISIILYGHIFSKILFRK